MKKLSDKLIAFVEVLNIIEVETNRNTRVKLLIER